MADFSSLAVVTNAGIAAEATAKANSWTLNFTKVVVGSGIIAAQVPELLTTLLNYVMDAELIGVNNLVSYQATIRFQVSSANVVSTFVLSEVGLMASLNGGTPFLYAYASAGDTGDTLVPTTTGAPLIDQYTLAVPYSNAPNITATLAVYPQVNLHALTHLDNGIDPISLPSTVRSGLCPANPNDATRPLVGTNPPSWGYGFFSGMIVDWGGVNAPTGWLLCDGSPYSKAIFANLYAALGGASSPWGQTTLTFNVPNTGGRVSVGAGTGYALGATGGEATHTLTISEIPIHSHTASGHALDHSHTASGNAADHTHLLPLQQAMWSLPGGGTLAPDDDIIGGHPWLTSGFSNYGPTTRSGGYCIPCSIAVGGSNYGAGYSIPDDISVNNNGAGATHNNMQPYAVFNRIIKI